MKFGILPLAMMGRRTAVPRLAAAWLLMLGFGFGCEGGLRERVPKKTKGSGALLSGRVVLAPEASLPRYHGSDLSRPQLLDRAAQARPTGCVQADRQALQPVTQGAERGLSGVVVGASEFSGYRDRPRAIHRVVIEDCRLQPGLVAAMAGDTITVENRDDYPFAPAFGAAFEGRPLPRHRPVALPPLLGGWVESIQCPPSAPCGRTDVVTFHHPVFAVTGADGRFQIADFPIRKNVKLSAWHPLFKVAESFVWLEHGETRALQLVLEPKKRFAAAAGEAHAP
ncbi:MAG: hypothetical protein OEZ06_00350 [Myxococcales bacterium]|nr:hypothetical protein [Myxococcales bacterium]